MGARSRYRPAYSASPLPCEERRNIRHLYKTNEAPLLFASIDGTATVRHTPHALVASPEQSRDVPAAPPERNSQHSRDAVGARSFNQMWSSGQDSGKIPMNHLMPKALCTVVRPAKTLVM